MLIYSCNAGHASPRLLAAPNESGLAFTDSAAGHEVTAADPKRFEVATPHKFQCGVFADVQTLFRRLLQRESAIFIWNRRSRFRVGFRTCL